MGRPPRRMVLKEKKRISMTYREGKKLHNGDEIQVKSTGCFMHVIGVEVQPKDVFIRATDVDTPHE